MALDALIRNLIAGPILSVAGPLRTEVQLTRMTGRGTYGPTYGAPSDELALVEAMNENVASADGSMKLSTSKFTFIEPLTIGEGDRLTVNGVTTVVIKVGGLLDPAGVPYITEAWTGK